MSIEKPSTTKASERSGGSSRREPRGAGGVRWTYQSGPLGLRIVPNHEDHENHEEPHNIPRGVQLLETSTEVPEFQEGMILAYVNEEEVPHCYTSVLRMGESYQETSPWS